MTLWMSKKQIDSFHDKTNPKAKKPSKYCNQKTEGYDSRKEAKRASELKLMAKAGLITNLVEQPGFEIIPKQDGERAAVYTADFSYTENGKKVVEDVKSKATKTEAYVLRRKLMLLIHGVKIKEV